MEHNLKRFIENVGKESKNLVSEHIKEIEIKEEYKEIFLYIDKLYAIHELDSPKHIDDIIKSVKKTFGDEYQTVIKFKLGQHIPHEKEKLIPHTIHFY